MKPITNEDIKVLGRIVNISTENVVADASQVWDSEQKKDQETINDSLINKTDNATTSKYGIVRLAVNASDPDNTDVVTVKTLRDAIDKAISDLINRAPGTLDTFRELAEALGNNPNFYTWVTDQLALKADKSDLISLERRVEALEALRNKINQIDGILTRLATAEADIDELKACCEMAKQYMNFYTVSWNKTRGGDHVTITPSIVKAGEQTVTFTIHEGYYYNTSSGGPITNPDLIDGQYGTVTLESYADGVYTIKFSDVQSNITMNGFISKRSCNVTNNVRRTNLSNPGPVLYGNTYQSTITPAEGYQIDSVTVTMNGQTVSGAYNNGAITVPNVNGPIVITGTTSRASQVGNIIVAIQHGTPSSLVFPANGVTHTATVQPDNGYTSVNPEITTNNPQVNATVSGTTVTITGTSSTNVMININYKPDSTPTTYGTVTVSPNHGTASPASFSADGTSHTITITPASGYTTTGMTATTTNNDLTVSVSGNTITVTGTSSNNATINVTVPAESTPEDQNVNRGNMYVTFVNAKSPDKSVRPVSTTASSFTMGVEPPYDTMTTTSERDLWEYDMTISVKDIDGNEYVTYDTTDTSDFYKITGLHTASYNQPAILSGSGVSGTIRPSTSRNTIGFESISSNKDLYITITYQDSFSNTGDTTFYTHLGKDQRDGASYNREWFSFNALGKYTNPLIPYDIKSLDSSEESSYTCVYGDPTYGEASRSINIGNISSISGLTGSTDSEKFADLQTKISYLFVKKAGISNGSDVYYNDYKHLETSENGCPFAVSNVSLDSNSNVILTITCAAADPTAGVATETFESVTFRTSDASDVVTWNTTTTDQHLKGSYHVSQLLVLCGDSVIYSERLCREIYGFINCYPNTTSGPVTTKGVWHGSGYYFLQPMNAFTAKSGYDTLPDLSIAINDHGTSTNAGINLTYNNDGTITDPTMIGGAYVDISMTASPVNNTYPSLTSTYNNFRRVNGIELIINGVPPTFS